MITDSRIRYGEYITFGNHTLEIMNTFAYLSSLVTNENVVKEEIQRFVIANMAYFGLQRKFSSKLLSKVTKSLLYKH